MALINCIECDKEISDKAETCVHCGYPYLDGSKKSTVKIYDTNDIQEIFKCSRKLAYELMNSDQFPSFKINSKLLISEDNLKDFLKKNTNKQVFI